MIATILNTKRDQIQSKLLEDSKQKNINRLIEVTFNTAKMLSRTGSKSQKAELRRLKNSLLKTKGNKRKICRVVKISKMRKYFVKLKQVKNLFNALTRGENSLFYSADQIRKNLVRKIKTLITKKTKLFCSFIINRKIKIRAKRVLW